MDPEFRSNAKPRLLPSHLMGQPGFYWTGTLSFYISTCLEQGGVSQAEAAPSIQQNRESISVSGLYFSPFCHIQTIFSVLSYLLINYLLLPNMSHGEHVGLDFDGLDAPSNTLDPIGVSGSSGGKRTVANQGTSLHIHEQSDIPALASGSSDTHLFG